MANAATLDSAVLQSAGAVSSKVNPFLPSFYLYIEMEARTAVAEENPSQL